jgi:hypothetical protein
MTTDKNKPNMLDQDKNPRQKQREEEDRYDGENPVLADPATLGELNKLKKELRDMEDQGARAELIKEKAEEIRKFKADKEKGQTEATEKLADKARDEAQAKLDEKARGMDKNRKPGEDRDVLDKDVQTRDRQGRDTGRDSGLPPPNPEVEAATLAAQSFRDVKTIEAGEPGYEERYGSRSPEAEAKEDADSRNIYGSGNTPVTVDEHEEAKLWDDTSPNNANPSGGQKPVVGPGRNPGENPDTNPGQNPLNRPYDPDKDDPGRIPTNDGRDPPFGTERNLNPNRPSGPVPVPPLNPARNVGPNRPSPGAAKTTTTKPDSSTTKPGPNRPGGTNPNPGAKTR